MQTDVQLARNNEVKRRADPAVQMRSPDLFVLRRTIAKRKDTQCFFVYMAMRRQRLV